MSMRIANTSSMHHSPETALFLTPKIEKKLEKNLLKLSMRVLRAHRRLFWGGGRRVEARVPGRRRAGRGRVGAAPAAGVRLPSV